jgi:hypothetical protein
MKDDAEIQRNVATELKWSPDVDETDIAVKVSRGIVTLTGFVHTYPEKFRAEAAVKRVGGVVAVANDIEVRLPAQDTVSDRVAVPTGSRRARGGWIARGRQRTHLDPHSAESRGGRDQTAD